MLMAALQRSPQEVPELREREGGRAEATGQAAGWSLCSPQMSIPPPLDPTHTHLPKAVLAVTKMAMK
jgi:hypothetical protein